MLVYTETVLRTWELWWGKKKGARTETERKGDRKEREREREVEEGEMVEENDG